MMLTTKETKDLLLMYQRDALKTALRTDYGKDLLIRACGLIGEWGEYLRAGAVTRGEELADCFWYAAAIADLVGVSIADFVISPTITKPDVDMTTCAIAACAEYAKKVGGHGRDKPLTDLTRHLGDVVNQLVAFAHVLGPNVTLPEILAANIAKLRARHAQAGAGGFDPNYGKPLTSPSVGADGTVSKLSLAPPLPEGELPEVPGGVPFGFVMLADAEYAHLQDLARTGQVCVENHHPAITSIGPITITGGPLTQEQIDGIMSQPRMPVTHAPDLEGLARRESMPELSPASSHTSPAEREHFEPAPTPARECDHCGAPTVDQAIYCPECKAAGKI